MPENIKGSNTTVRATYNTLIPSLSDNADIVSALKIYHYGSAVDTDEVAAESISEYLKNKADVTLVDAKGDFLVGSANNTLIRVAPPGGNDYILKTNTSTTSGVEWVQTNYQQDQVSYVMGLY
jgi:hypothetical protein